MTSMSRRRSITEPSCPAKIPVAVLFNLHADWPPSDKLLVLRETAFLVNSLKQLGHPCSAHPVGSLRIATKILDHLNPKKCVILNWCEALPGDPHKGEAAVAGLLEKRGFTFTGSTAAALALSADKAATKLRLNNAGISTPVGRIFQTNNIGGWTLFPAIVKSAHEHSSADLSDKSVAKTPGQLRQIIKKAMASDKRGVMVEAFVTGRELNVTVWGNAPGEIDILPPVEVWMDGRLDAVYSYADKFGDQVGTPTSTRLVCPVRIGKRQLAIIRDAAIAAYSQMNCRDYARVDGRLDGRTFTVLDINPNPDLCQSAESALAANVSGTSYGQFVSGIVHLAARRHPSLRRYL
jgi:D-alanine-D-alanine ligase